MIDRIWLRVHVENSERSRRRRNCVYVEHEFVDLVEAMVDFRARPARASNRQEAIQIYCCDELHKRGLDGARIEVPMHGAYRVKQWDVGLTVEGEPRLGISCKLIISNHGGTVPNRVDDLLGETVSLHRAFPTAVLGYLFMMSRRDESLKESRKTANTGGLTPARRQELHDRADHWFELLVGSVNRASNRRGPGDVPEKFEVVSCSQIDFDQQPYRIMTYDSEHSPDTFFDRLVTIYRERFG